MSQPIKSLDISGFRGISSLAIQNVGRVNLITGRNNAGKSSLLEAVRVLITGGSMKTIHEILNYREEIFSDDPERVFGYNDVAPFCSLLNGFPDVSSSKSLSVSATGGIPASISRISIKIGWFARRSDPDQASFRFEPIDADFLGDIDRFPALDMDIAGKRRIVPLDRVSRRYFLRSEPDVNLVPCVNLDPFSSRSTGQLGVLWDAIALTESEREVVEALRVISDDIEAVSMIGSDERNMRSRIAIAKSRAFDSPIPLRTFGDGVNRLFGIILSLCNARNGVLLVDEIENGLHYSIQAAVWKAIFRLSRKLNVQIFATTHSWDCVRSFQEAATESPEDGILVRLTKKGEKTIATLFTEQELEIVSRDQVEVR